jgi:hypothetical protein
VHGARRIIIGTNGSPGSLQALRCAAGMVQGNDATLVPALAWLPPGGIAPAGRLAEPRVLRS